jgi:cytochrome c2
MKWMAAVTIASAMLCGCSNRSRTAQAAAMTGGNPKSGKNKIAFYGCGSCHDIKGVPGAVGLVGPPLGNVALRVYLGGVLPNTPNNMALWIRNPKQFDEKTAMPVLYVTEQDARDITAYLYSLK